MLTTPPSHCPAACTSLPSGIPGWRCRGVRGTCHPSRNADAAFLTTLAPLAALALLVACDDGGSPTGPTPEPASIELLSGDSQRAVQGLALDDSIVVRVVDSRGAPTAGETVGFSPAPGHGSTSPASVVTGPDGTAAALWTLGPDPGTQTLTIAVGNASRTATATSVDLEAELDGLFAPASAAEIMAVRADWSARAPGAEGVRVELDEAFDLAGSSARLRIVSHVVDGNRHMGAVVVPEAVVGGKVPVLAYLHGGENGAVTSDLAVVAEEMGELRDSFVYVIPAFRGEEIRHNGVAWLSEGGKSPWDRDVDDALALLDVALELAPEADPGSINLLGFSRGAAVALIAGIRDPGISRIAAFFGPTLFFDDWVRGIVRKAALRLPQSVTGLETLDSTLIQPFVKGAVGLPDARLSLVRRSAVLFAADLPPLQWHHGTFDLVVPIAQGEALAAAMRDAGRDASSFEYHVYEGGSHSPFLLEGSIPRTIEYLSRALGAESDRDRRQ